MLRLLIRLLPFFFLLRVQSNLFEKCLINTRWCMINGWHERLLWIVFFFFFDAEVIFIWSQSHSKCYVCVYKLNTPICSCGFSVFLRLSLWITTFCEIMRQNSVSYLGWRCSNEINLATRERERWKWKHFVIHQICLCVEWSRRERPVIVRISVYLFYMPRRVWLFT